MTKTHNDREPPHKLGYHPITHQIASLNAAKQSIFMLVLRQLMAGGTWSTPATILACWEAEEGRVGREATWGRFELEGL